jgi:hypothetical protein
MRLIAAGGNPRNPGAQAPKSVIFTAVPARSKVVHGPIWRPRSKAPVRTTEPSAR